VTTVLPRPQHFRRRVRCILGPAQFRKRTMEVRTETDCHLTLRRRRKEKTAHGCYRCETTSRHRADPVSPLSASIQADAVDVEALQHARFALAMRPPATWGPGATDRASSLRDTTPGVRNSAGDVARRRQQTHETVFMLAPCLADTERSARR
jgi:hypothetical protein